MKQALAFLLSSFALLVCALPAPLHAGETGQRVRLHADLRGSRAVVAAVDYVEEGPRRRVRVVATDLRHPLALVELGGSVHALTVDPVTGVGTLELDSRVDARVPRLRVGEAVRLKSGDGLRLRGRLTLR